MRACFEALRGRIGTKDYSEVPLPGGYVGLFVSSKSQDVLSKDISGWLAARD
jgi:poly[(R)-3-hydroxyalkanoate] polymerase subunit PhaC